MPNKARPVCGEGIAAPCFNCTERVPPTAEHKGCHGTCGKYKEFCKLRDEIREERHAKSDTQSYLIDKSIAAKAKSMKKRRKWGSNRG